MKEDDPELGAIVLRLGHETAVHVGVTAGLEDEKLTDGVEVFERVAPLLHDGATAQGRDAATDNPKGFARGVIIDARHHQAAAGRWPVHRFMLTQPDAAPSGAMHAAGSRRAPG